MKVDIAVAVGNSALFQGVDTKDLAEIVAAAVSRKRFVRSYARAPKAA